MELNACRSCSIPGISRGRVRFVRAMGRGGLVAIEQEVVAHHADHLHRCTQGEQARSRVRMSEMCVLSGAGHKKHRCAIQIGALQEQCTATNKKCARTQLKGVCTAVVTRCAQAKRDSLLDLTAACAHIRP
eukprot:298344-Pelagomonas_calceolata.AAC.3